MGVLPARRRAPGSPGHRGRDPAVSGDFQCVPYSGDNLYRFGPPRMSADRRHLVHAGPGPAPGAAGVDGVADGVPFFWLADTVWNGPLLATPEEWSHYLRVRRGQGFSAAQFVSTHWRTAPEGGGGLAYTGGEHLERVRPEFFRRLDARLDELAEAGMVGVPVLLWAIGGGVGAERNPGHILSEEDCALLAGYQVARWQAHPVAFILNGDGRYTGHAPRWQRIGRAVFGATDPRTRPPVAVHPGGQQWVGESSARALAGHPGLPERPRRERDRLALAGRWAAGPALGGGAPAGGDQPGAVLRVPQPDGRPARRRLRSRGALQPRRRAPGLVLEPAGRPHRRGDLRGARRLGLGRRLRPPVAHERTGCPCPGGRPSPCPGRRRCGIWWTPSAPSPGGRCARTLPAADAAGSDQRRQ